MIVPILLALLGRTAFAHGTADSLAPDEAWSAWRFDPGVVIALLLSGGLYSIGLHRLWRSSGPGRGIQRWEAASFWLGWCSLFIALVSPLHAIGSVLFSAHMIQHEVLMIVSAPLLVLGRPLIPLLWGVPMSWRKRLGPLASLPMVRRSWLLLSSTFVAWALHAAVLWGWHLPSLFQATLTNDLMHTCQHVSFLGSALLFCWALLHVRNGREGYGAAVLYLFTTAIHTSVLGALLTFSHTVWYPGYLQTTSSWGVTALEDQQIGGLIMWVPAGVFYLIAGLALFALWIRTAKGARPATSIGSEDSTLRSMTLQSNE